jgi:hypothetical protein
MHELIFSKRLPEMRCEIKRRRGMWRKPFRGLQQWQVTSGCRCELVLPRPVVLADFASIIVEVMVMMRTMTIL